MPVDANLHKLGLDSITSIEIIHELSRRLGVNLDADVLVQYPTINDLSDYLKSSKPHYRHLVSLKDGTGRALVLIHPIEGDLVCFTQLLKALDLPNPIYGLRTFNQAPESTMESLAQSYLQELRQENHQHMPLIVGASFGGCVAYEMASQWQEEGALPEVILLDSINPRGVEGQKSSLDLLGILLGLDDHVSQKDKVGAVIKALGRPNLDKTDEQNLRAIIERHIDMLDMWEPKPYKGKVCLYGSGREVLELMRGSWEGVCTLYSLISFGLENHLGILSGLEVLKLADKLSMNPY